MGLVMSGATINRINITTSLSSLYFIAAFIVCQRKIHCKSISSSTFGSVFMQKLMFNVYVNAQFTKTLSLFTLVASLCVHIAQIKWKYQICKVA